MRDGATRRRARYITTPRPVTSAARHQPTTPMPPSSSTGPAWTEFPVTVRDSVLRQRRVGGMAVS